jgi:flagellar motor switch protein FliN/FliY
MSKTEQAAPESGAAEDGAKTPAAEEFAAARFENLEADAPGREQAHRLDMILDVPVSLSLEVGRTNMSVGELLQLSQGSVVELDRLAGEPLDVLVNGTLVAHGEIVVVNDKFGIRLTDVVSPAERVRKLR